MRRVYKAAGDSVQAGEVLALIDSIEVGKAKAEFQHALVQARLRERRRDDLVGSKSASSPAAIREAEAALKEADVQVLATSQTLTNLGLPLKSAEYRALTPKDVAQRIRLLGVEDAVKDLDVVTANLLPVRASFKGVVLSADAVAGEVVEAGKALFAIVDPSRVWVTVNVGPEESRRVAVSQQVYFRPDGSAREYPATVQGTRRPRKHLRRMPPRTSTPRPKLQVVQGARRSRVPALPSGPGPGPVPAGCDGRRPRGRGPVPGVRPSFGKRREVQEAQSPPPVGIR